MTSAKIALKSIENVKHFINIVSRFEANMDLVRGRYIIDAKSIMGVFSLDLTQPVELRIFDDGEPPEEILMQLKDYVI